MTSWGGLGQQLLFKEKKKKLKNKNNKGKRNTKREQYRDYNLHVYMYQINKSKPNMQYNCYFTIISGLIKIFVVVYCKQADDKLS